MLLRSACSQVKLTDTLRTYTQVCANNIAFLLYSCIEGNVQYIPRIMFMFCPLLYFAVVCTSQFTHIFKVEPSDDGLIMRFSQCQWGVEVSISYEFKTYNLN